jgi:hypothetical protein
MTAAVRAIPIAPVESRTGTLVGHLAFVDRALIALAFGAGATI